MIYVILYRGVLRDETVKDWRTVAGAFLTGSVVGGFGVGYLLGNAGAAVSAGNRTMLVALLALFGLAVGIIEFAVHGKVPLLQRNRETRREWLFGRPVAGAFGTGVVIGSGFFTRIGFWLWYVVPVSCLATRSPLAGAAIFGCYSFVRAFIPTMLSAGVGAEEKRGENRAGHRLQDRMINHLAGVRLLCSILLVVVTTAFLTN